MYTGFWIEDKFIFGPRDSGRFWVEDGWIWGPRNSGKYWIKDGFVWGPHESGKFWIADGHIYGPHANPPWLDGYQIYISVVKFCYLDESGTGDEPFAVMAGILVDAYRMRPTKEAWDGLLAALSEVAGREILEFHTRDFYAGNSPWRGVDGPLRAEILTTIFEWYAERRHHIVYSVIDKQLFRGSFESHPYTTDAGTMWRVLALHIALALQKQLQKQKSNKGNFVLVFDEHGVDSKHFTQLLSNPPAWTDSYYSRSAKQNRLNQIIDVPHFVDSRHVGMIQLADCVSYFLRRYCEISSGSIAERYAGEEKRVGEWVELIQGQCIASSAIYPKSGRCEAAEYFYQLAPATLK